MKLTKENFLRSFLVTKRAKILIRRVANLRDEVSVGHASSFKLFSEAMSVVIGKSIENAEGTKHEGECFQIVSPVVVGCENDNSSALYSTSIISVRICSGLI